MSNLSEPAEISPADAAMNRLASNVQNRVPVQPWGRDGNEPVTVEIFYNQYNRSGSPWAVRFVAAVRGNRRVWKIVSGKTLREALTRAAEEQ